MAAYTETFTRERIDGQLLMELNEGILKEIGITGQEHLNQLMQIIAGECSIKSLVQ